MSHPDRIEPEEMGDLHTYDPDTRTVWQIICEYPEDALIGALIGAFVLFPGLSMVMTALAVIAEAAQ